MAIRLSTPSKMKGTCATWSLQAIDTCPGARDKSGDMVPACDNCYAMKGLYHMPSVKQLRADNMIDWQRETWTQCMVHELSTHAYFRWFDSGDMYHIDLAQKIYLVMKASPNTKFWLPTRMQKFDKFRAIIRKMKALPNVVVRTSSDSIDGKTIRGATTSTIIASDSQAQGAHVCPATEPGKVRNCKANACTACWDKNTQVVAYHYH